MKKLLIVVAMLSAGCVQRPTGYEDRRIPEYVYLQDADGNCWAMNSFGRYGRLQPIHQEVCDIARYAAREKEFNVMKSLP